MPQIVPSEFIRKCKPSAFDAEPSEINLKTPAPWHLRSAADNPATLYGRWWHSFLEVLDWRGGASAAQRLFEARLPASPNPEQSVKDWAATRRNLFFESALAPFLARAEVRAHREFPFSWKVNDRAVLEGVIDLLVIDEAVDRCLLLDWKTNQSDVDKLRARYLPQLAAYWKAVSEITGLQIQAGLYSTALGKLLIYEESELTHEWARLATLSSAELRSEMAARRNLITNEGPNAK